MVGMRQKADVNESLEQPTALSLATVARKRLLDEMLAPHLGGPNDWSTLILDAVTVKIFSSVVRVSDLVFLNIALLEDLNKGRQPMPTTAGIYFISPCATSVRRLIFDFGAHPMYKEAHVYFSNQLSPALMATIQTTPGLTSHLATFKELHLEFSVLDRRVFSTCQEAALQHLFGDGTAGQQDAYHQEVHTAASRIASLLVSLQEFPNIRFRAAKPSDDEPVLDGRMLAAQRVAVAVHDQALALQKLGMLPSPGETCDLLIVDRAFDVIAPLIHEWTYEAMVEDLLVLQNGIFRYETQTNEGKSEPREHNLGEADQLWESLRFSHFAAASLAITQQFEHFCSVNKAASYKSSTAAAASSTATAANGKAATGKENGGAGKEKTAAAAAAEEPALDMRSMAKLVKSLPQYREQLKGLAVHVEMASRVSAAVDARHLAQLGTLEQSLVFGNASQKQLIDLLTGPLAPQLTAPDKLRLLLIYTAANPEHMDTTKQLQWQKLGRLSQPDMETVQNLEMLGVPLVAKAKSGGLFGGKKRHRPIRKEREGDEREQQFTLSRFVPLLADLVEDLAAGKLSQDDYPSVSVHHPGGKDGPGGKGMKAVSVRSNRSTANWARKAVSSVAGSPIKLPPKERRILVFVLGGICHSEIRVIHQLSRKMQRDVVLGSTSVDNPTAFLQHLHHLGSLEGVANRV